MKKQVLSFVAISSMAFILAVPAFANGSMSPGTNSGVYSNYSSGVSNYRDGQMNSSYANNGLSSYSTANSTNSSMNANRYTAKATDNGRRSNWGWLGLLGLLGLAGARNRNRDPERH
ncbi:WGxxGxxG family protein [Paenibacillus sp. D51F]